MKNHILEAIGYPHSVIHEYKHWIVALRLEQITIGSLVILAKSDATKLGNLSSETWGEFAQVSADCEQLLEKAFQAEKFNYCAFMMKDPNVHFHFVPRYSKPVTVNGKEYADVDWPLKTEFNKLKLNDEDMAAIKSQLEEAA